MCGKLKRYFTQKDKRVHHVVTDFFQRVLHVKNWKPGYDGGHG